MKITAFIFTKDRACQCRLLLESFKRNCPQLFSPYILYKASDNAYLKGYQKLGKEFNDCFYVEETKSIPDEFASALHTAYSESGLVTIFTDDCIFFKECRALPEQISSAFDENTISFSFRLGFNTIVQDYKIGSLQPKLSNYTTFSFGNDDCVRWRWKDFGDTLNYGYPFAMDGCTYLAEDLLKLMEGWNFDTFRTWEGASNGPPRRNRVSKEYMTSFTQSRVVNVPVNSMQWPPLEAGSKYPVSVKELNDKFLDGYVIDLDKFDFSNVVGAHQEFPIEFKKL